MMFGTAGTDYPNSLLRGSLKCCMFLPVPPRDGTASLPLDHFHGDTNAVRQPSPTTSLLKVSESLGKFEMRRRETENIREPQDPLTWICEIHHWEPLWKPTWFFAHLCSISGHFLVLPSFTSFTYPVSESEVFLMSFCDPDSFWATTSQLLRKCLFLTLLLHGKKSQTRYITIM